MSQDALLSTPPAFILLAVAVAMSAYLRNLSETRDKLIDDIEADKVDKFKLILPYTKERIQHLKRSRDNLNRIAPVLISFTVLIAFRLLLLAVWKLLPQAGLFARHLDIIFPWMDLAITIWLFAILVGLWYMHIRGRTNDRRVRILIEGHRMQESLQTVDRRG